MTVYIGADHRGFSLKDQIKGWLLSNNHGVIDCSKEAIDMDDDYPDIAFSVADHVSKNTESFGILLCGSGGGVVIAANKVNGIRAAVGVSKDDVVHNRDHNNINILAIASDFTSYEEAKGLVSAFLDTPFNASIPRFSRRLAKISARET